MDPGAASPARGLLRTCEPGVATERSNRLRDTIGWGPAAHCTIPKTERENAALNSTHEEKNTSPDLCAEMGALDAPHATCRPLLWALSRMGGRQSAIDAADGAQRCAPSLSHVCLPPGAATVRVTNMTMRHLCELFATSCRCLSREPQSTINCSPCAKMPCFFAPSGFRRERPRVISLEPSTPNKSLGSRTYSQTQHPQTPILQAPASPC